MIVAADVFVADLPGSYPGGRDRASTVCRGTLDMAEVVTVKIFVMPRLTWAY